MAKYQSQTQFFVLFFHAGLLDGRSDYFQDCDSYFKATLLEQIWNYGSNTTTDKFLSMYHGWRYRKRQTNSIVFICLEKNTSTLVWNQYLPTQNKTRQPTLPCLWHKTLAQRRLIYLDTDEKNTCISVQNQDQLSFISKDMDIYLLLSWSFIHECEIKVQKLYKS